MLTIAEQIAQDYRTVVAESDLAAFEKEHGHPFAEHKYCLQCFEWHWMGAVPPCVPAKAVDAYFAATQRTF